MKPKYSSQGDSFVIENYNHAAPFSDFFPALAGVTGKPMWAFYTNRGQAIAGFGVNNKDGSMMEFLPANKAYQSTPTLGFRTFIKIGKGADVYEPFALHSSGVHQSMTIRTHEIELVDRNPALGLETTVVYYGVPNENVPALARSLTVRNIGPRSIDLRVVDGLPRVVPFGENDYLIKNMARTIEAFAEVVNVRANVPFFKLKIEPHDRPEIKWLSSGFFSLALSDSSLLPIIVDPAVVFGPDTAFLKPWPFLEKPALSVAKQLTANTMPCSFYQDSVSLKPKESHRWLSLYGYGSTVGEAGEYAARVKQNKNYFDEKRAEMRGIYEELVGHLGIETGDAGFDQYAKATFLDNVLRGGFPLSVGPKGPIIHVFSRKHGDMERDYNAFQISATYYSQGNANFRDVNQNRRNDILLNSEVGTANVDLFFNLIQLDGYNPLVLNPERYVIPKDLIARFDLKMTDQCRNDYQLLVKEPALAGHLYEFLKKHAADPLNVGNYFREIISQAQVQPSVQHADGFWVDHWTYNLDHLDQYLNVFPEKKVWLFFEKNDYTFHDTDYFVKPRRDKYIVTREGKLRQYEAIGHSAQKQQLIAGRSTDPRRVRVDNGAGDVLRVNLFTKLIALAAIKTATLDPDGIGIEMEADKPGWCDALNGAPGLFGSSTHEMFELHRLVKTLLWILPFSPNKTLDMPHEILNLVKDVQLALEGKTGDFRPVWDRLAAARESFREKTFMGVSGKTRSIRTNDLKEFLERASEVLSEAERRAIDSKSGVPVSYFTYDADAAKLDDAWRQFLHKIPWKRHNVASFLEGPVHAMKMATPAKVKQIYQAVRKSHLYDAKLGMYRLNVSLAQESDELGRVRIFTPGWLENESIFLHMHYKYLLEILRSGMTETFLKESRTGLIPFRDPETYGRPTFQNSSFVASSAFPDADYHGRGFVARLSGATSEFLSMMYFMAFGAKFFKDVNGQILFSPEPRLPREWFTKNGEAARPRNSLSLKLFGVPVTYVNAGRRNTFGAGAAKPVGFEWILEGRFYEAKGRMLAPDASLALREGRLESLTILLG